MKNTRLLEKILEQMGYDSLMLESLLTEGHILLPEKNGQQILLCPSEEGDAVFIVCHLMTIDPFLDSKLLALALHLNLSPAYTLAASVALDVEQNLLCLRYAHHLLDNGAFSLETALDNFSGLANRIREILMSCQQEDFSLPDKPELQKVSTFRP